MQQKGGSKHDILSKLQSMYISVQLYKCCCPGSCCKDVGGYKLNSVLANNKHSGNMATSLQSSISLPDKQLLEHSSSR